MPEAAHNLDREFWRPPEQAQSAPAEAINTGICPRCNSDFVVGARFCHVCGAEREAQPEFSYTGLTRWLDFQVIRQSLGLSVGALVAFIVGLACTAAAIATGFIYTANTMLDWQAVQLWRVEWLLAAAVAFLAGILLKRAA